MLRITQLGLVIFVWALALSNWLVPGFREFWLLGELPEITITAPERGAD